MNSFQTLFNQLHDPNSRYLEVTATLPKGILITASGNNYNSYSELPSDIQLCVDKVLMSYPAAFAVVHRAGHRGYEAIDRVLRCLFGGYDCQPDIDMATGTAEPEYPSFCEACEYDHCFCVRKVAPLSRAETSVAFLIKDGFTDKEIAFRTGKAENTIRNQRRNMELKLRAKTHGLVNTATITRYMIEYGG
jgi:DNA-binding CsgD family transcriptional regulator